MSSGVYGGDEVGALVFDPGHYSFRIGYAGEDCPKAELPGSIGFVDLESTEADPTRSIHGSKDSSADENQPPQFHLNGTGNKGKSTAAHPNRKYFIDTTATHVPTKGVEMTSFLKDGQIENWEVFEAVMDHSYRKHLMTESNVHPVLMSEPPWNTKAKRERLTELLFEKYNIPALFLCKTAVLASFANGKSTALVLDSGATHTSAIPVYDGYCVTQSIVRSPLGGDAITTWCKQFLDEQQVEVVPSYMIQSKETVGEREKAAWTRKPSLPEVTKSYHDTMTKEVIQDFQASVLQVCDTPFDSEHAEKWPSLHYEFPNGYHQDFVSERLRIPEGIFDPSVLKNLPNPSQMPGIGQLVTSAINACDIDMRSALYNNIVVTGGNSLLQGFVERLNHDIQTRCPSNMKVKIFSAVSTAERRFGPWIGGSILASLGSFQQMWISKQEYEESGKSVVDKKCP